MVALGQSEDTGKVCADIKFDGTFLSVNGKMAQPQSGYLNTNNLYVSLNDLSGARHQQWTLRNTGEDAERKRSKQAPSKSDAWGFDSKNHFEIRAYNGQVVYVRGGQVGIRNRQNNADEQFIFNAGSKTIVSRRDSRVSLASKEIGNGRFKLVARRTERTSAELFNKPNSGGIIQMAANKNYVWRADGNGVSIVKANGDRNWRRARTYFQAVRR